MKVTSIKQQLKNPERVSVFVDGQYSFSLSLDELVKHKLSGGQELTAAEIKKFIRISEDGKLRTRSLEWLLNRPHSAREFGDYLYRKKANPQLAENLKDEFAAKGYLDDGKFAVWLIDVLSRKNKSRKAIRAELIKKGISREQIEAAFEKSRPDEERALKEIIAKKVKSSRYKKDKMKLASYLTSQGFSYDLVKKALAVAVPED